MVTIVSLCWCPCAAQVVWDDSIMRLFVVPTAGRALGLVFRAIKGQVDFEAPLGEWGIPCGEGWIMPWIWGCNAYRLQAGSVILCG